MALIPFIPLSSFDLNIYTKQMIVQFDWGAPGIIYLLIVFHKFYPNNIMIHLQVYKLDLRRYYTLLMSLLEKSHSVLQYYLVVSLVRL